jgi:hypothetical protein
MRFGTVVSVIGVITPRIQRAINGSWSYLNSHQIWDVRWCGVQKTVGVVAGRSVGSSQTNVNVGHYARCVPPVPHRKFHYTPYVICAMTERAEWLA